MSKKVKKTEDLPQDKNEASDETEDIVFESEENQGGDDAIKKLRQKLKKATAEKQEYLAGWQRAKADLINAKKEFGEEKTELLKFANTDLILRIIPVLDSFEMALNDEKTQENDLLKEWAAGTRHIYSQLLSVLGENGVEQFNPLGEKFNPAAHNSVESVKIDDKEKDGIITEVIQKGYFLNGKVVREAGVKVGEYVEINSKVQNPNYSK